MDRTTELLSLSVNPVKNRITKLWLKLVEANAMINAESERKSANAALHNAAHFEKVALDARLQRMDLQ